jgi:signal transduction histidine kinase
MDQVRGDFVATTQQLLRESDSPQVLAQNFDRKLRDAWPMAEIGFAVNLNGEIYSPEPYDGPAARAFRDENDRFLSNRENVEVYSSNSVVLSQNGQATQNAVAQFSLKSPGLTFHVQADKAKNVEQSVPDLRSEIVKNSTTIDSLQNQTREASSKSAAARLAVPASAQNQNAPTGSDTNFVSDISRAKNVVSPSATDQFASESASSGASTAAPSTAPASTDFSAVTNSPPTAAPAPAMPSATPQLPIPTSATAAMPSAEAGATETPEPQTISANPASSLAVARSLALGGEEMSGKDATNAVSKIQRQVIPQQMLANNTASLSNTVPEESDFRRVIGTETSGELARFLENKMRLLVWSHPAQDAPIVYGAQLDQGKVVESLKASLQIPELAPDSYSRTSNGEICAAILDDTGQPVALSRPGFQGDWKHPFVATEIGEVLPHWEAALYLVDPQQISRAARTLQLTFGLIVLLLVAAIVSGGSLIGADVRRQVRLAQQKTDFVSNVSHELKTPLTSIRMFADLLAEKRVPDEERQATYLRIIAAEASRLTRLINNVLDFARLERGAPPGEHHDCDLVDAVRDVAETCGPHLEAAGISFQCEIEAEALPIRGDRDALAQIILNLISNAEKYGGNDVLVRVRRQETASGALGCVDVLDRGAGIPAREAKTIFEPFHRLDDSLSSGIPGSGLGLTLARRMARAHGGDVTYSARAGGGSCFTLSVPLAQNSSTA